jgi:hypothetical protein
MGYFLSFLLWLRKKINIKTASFGLTLDYAFAAQRRPLSTACRDLIM